MEVKSILLILKLIIAVLFIVSLFLCMKNYIETLDVKSFIPAILGSLIMSFMVFLIQIMFDKLNITYIDFEKSLIGTGGISIIQILIIYLLLNLNRSR